MSVDPFDRTCDAITALLIAYFEQKNKLELSARNKSRGRLMALSFGEERTIETDIETLHKRPVLFALEMGFRMFGEHLNKVGGVELMRAARVVVIDKLRVTSIREDILLYFFSKKWDGIGGWWA